VTESAPVSEAAPPVVPTNAVTAGRAITVVATGYALGGRTSTGLPVGWGVAAVDPSVIPLGTHMTVPGYGEAVAADVGGAVRGAVVDLWFPSIAQANAWGRRSVTIILH
jgi:resuscitation-promoting factor RpfB